MIDDKWYKDKRFWWGFVAGWVTYVSIIVIVLVILSLSIGLPLGATE